MNQAEKQIELLRPKLVPRGFMAGWQDHQAGFPRTASRPVEQRHVDAYLAGWDARHRLSCAAAAGRLLP